MIAIAVAMFLAAPASLLASQLIFRVTVPAPVFFGIWVFADAAGMIADLACGLWLPASGAAASGVLALALWWRWRSRRRRRVLRAYGAKSRARIAARARNMPRPRPVLRPVPKGAWAVTSRSR